MRRWGDDGWKEYKAVETLGDNAVQASQHMFIGLKCISQTGVSWARKKATMIAKGSPRYVKLCREPASEWKEDKRQWSNYIEIDARQPNHCLCYGLKKWEWLNILFGETLLNAKAHVWLVSSSWKVRTYQIQKLYWLRLKCKPAIPISPNIK